jgi:hypothetical protein
MASSNMDIDPADHEVEGQSFVNPALMGSGTINPNGTIGPALPDPTVVRGLDGRKTSGGREVPDPLTTVNGELVPTSTVNTQEDANLSTEWGKGEGRESKAATSTPATPKKSTTTTK